MAGDGRYSGREEPPTPPSRAHLLGMALTQIHCIEHACVWHGTHKLVQETHAVLESAFEHIVLDPYKEENDEQTHDQILNQTHNHCQLISH